VLQCKLNKHFVVLSHHPQTLPLTTSEVSASGTVVRWCCIDNTWLVAALTAHSEARYSLRIAISAYPTCIRCPG